MKISGTNLSYVLNVDTNSIVAIPCDDEIVVNHGNIYDFGRHGVKAIQGSYYNNLSELIDLPNDDKKHNKAFFAQLCKKIAPSDSNLTKQAYMHIYDVLESTCGMRLVGMLNYIANLHTDWQQECLGDLLLKTFFNWHGTSLTEQMKMARDYIEEDTQYFYETDFISPAIQSPVECVHFLYRTSHLPVCEVA